MNNPKPVLGYPSKSAAAAALSAEGLTQREIAARIGVKICSVGSLVCNGRRAARESNDVIKYVSALTSTNRDRLRRAAIQRGMNMRSLVNQLLTVIAEEQLVDAILDDGDQR